MSISDVGLLVMGTALLLEVRTRGMVRSVAAFLGASIATYAFAAVTNISPNWIIAITAPFVVIRQIRFAAEPILGAHATGHLLAVSLAGIASLVAQALLLPLRLGAVLVTRRGDD